MKVTLNIELNLPDFMASFSEAELRQTLFDEYINAVTCYHVDAILFIQESRLVENLPDVDLNARYEIAMEHHKRWAMLVKNAVWTAVI